MLADAYISSGVLELYVAGVLPEEQAHEVHAMALQHPQIQEEIERLEAVYREYSRHQAEFPEHLFTKIRDCIETMRETPALAPTAKKIPDERKENPIETERPTLVNHPTPGGRKITLRPFLAAALFFLALSALLNMYFYARWQDTRQSLVLMEKEKLTWNKQILEASASHKASQAMLSMYEDSTYIKVMLKGQAIAPSAMAIVFWNKKNNEVYLLPKNLPAVPEGKQYQLWAINQEGKPVDAGMVAPNQINSDIAGMKRVKEAKAFAISLESLGGSQAPTTTAIFLLGSTPPGG